MKQAWKLLGAMLCGAVFGAVSAAALADCETMEDRITSKPVPMFSTGENCPSPPGLYTEGRFTGDLDSLTLSNTSALSLSADGSVASPETMTTTIPTRIPTTEIRFLDRRKAT